MTPKFFLEQVRILRKCSRSSDQVYYYPGHFRNGTVIAHKIKINHVIPLFYFLLLITTQMNISNLSDPFFGSDKVRYAVFGKERGVLNGAPHLQGYVALMSKARFSAMHKALPNSHVEQAKGNEEQNYQYCTKDGEFEEFGRRASQGKRTDLDSAIELLKEGGIKRVIEEQPREYVKYHRGLEQLEYRLNNQPYEHHEVRGVWIWGPPGTGKSYSARLYDPNAYLKPQNKWWDGYEGQHTVILDDLDTPTLGHYLKIWSDRYACSGEFKGGTAHLRHRTLIITSNYTPHQLWPEDPVMAEAIKRRFLMNHKQFKDSPVEYRTTIEKQQGTLG
ncbi:hypothetical protein [uncultured marine virus]|uniref:ATP-dependent helicase Rep n=1 Tax=uncultured marine virus TaxID=186617 RepID=S4TF13_9VIRU|nr:hypothetical protein [uncultured marine virus]